MGKLGAAFIGIGVIAVLGAIGLSAFLGRTWARLGLVALVALTATALAVPALSRWLITQPTCVAFVGMKQVDPPASVDRGRKAWDLALAEGAVSRPRPPYVITAATGGDASFTNVLVAEKTASGWRVTEAGQPFDIDRQALLPFVRFPARMLDPASSRRLDQLLATSCLFSEPPFVEDPPRIRLTWRYRSMVYDGSTRLIEVHDGVRRHTVVQNHPAGVSGAIARLLATGGHGYLIKRGAAVESAYR